MRSHNSEIKRREITFLKILARSGLYMELDFGSEPKILNFILKKMFSLFLFFFKIIDYITFLHTRLHE